MNDLIVKEVDFMGDTLMAAQDKEKNIWAGVKWICQGLGLSVDQTKNERKRIQTDLVLKQGGSNLTLPTNGGNQEVLCLKLDFVPLWLAKISVTPKMKRGTPELVDRLVEYQLKAKDVLAAAFMPKQVRQRETAITPVEKFIDQQNYTLQEIRDQQNRFQNTMLQSFQLLSQYIINQSTTSVLNTQLKDNTHQSVQKESGAKEDGLDSGEIFHYVDICISKFSRFSNKRDVLTYVWDTMRNKYGVVWEQERKDFKTKNRYGYKSELKLILATRNTNFLYDIAISILKDMIADKYDLEKRQFSVETEMSVLHEAIIDYADKVGNKSPKGSSIYHKIFSRMDVDWSNYSLKRGGRKISLVSKDKKLKQEFVKQLNILLKEA